VASNGTWSIAVSFAGSGNHVITARDTDLAGNVGQSAPVTFTLATKSPTFTGLTRNSNGSATLTGTADANTRVTVFDGGTLLGAAAVNARGRWSFITGSGLSNTTHVFTAREIDAAGNISSTSGSAQLGSSGKDTLTSTADPDVMAGGKGADLFSFVANFGGDIITDFAASGSAHDIISFQANPVLNSYKAVMAHATQVGSSVVIRQDADNSLTLSNVERSSLTANDFAFG
jgi:Bacterial Ig-like domain